MKKAVSLILCVIIFCMSMPAVAMASENDPERDQLIADACAVFPEYAEKIHAKKLSINTRSSSREVVISESRKVSDNQIMAYTEYSDGTTFVASSNYSGTTTVTDRQSSAQAVVYTADLKVVSSYSSQKLIVKGVKFTCIKQGADCITSAGSVSESTTKNTYSYGLKTWEDDSDAEVCYFAQFTPYPGYGSTPFEPYIRFHVGNDSFALSIV